MKATRPRYRTSSGLSGVGPQLGFAAAVFAGFIAWTGLAASGATDTVMPVVATMLLLCAAGFALIAWRSRDEDFERVTYADVAGALTLIGLFAAATIDPDQLLRIVAADRTEN
jgi:hypothetical protein